MDDHTLVEGILASGINTEDQLREFLRASREPAPPTEGSVPEVPKPQVTETPTVSSAPAEDSFLPRAQAALSAQKEADTLVAGAKAILTEKLGHEPEGFTDEELLWHAGLSKEKPGETPQQRAHRERQEYEHRLATDPSMRGEYENVMRQREVESFRRAYWTLHPADRRERMEQLGLTPDTFTPPESFHGLD